MRDDTGRPLDGASVTLKGAATQISGPEGRFTFPNLITGDYEITVGLAGFAQVRRDVRVRSGATTIVTFSLSIQITEQTFVTAAKTGEQNPQDTPLSVSVLSANELSSVQAHTVEQIAGRAPAVTFSQNTGFSQLTIRGIGTNVVFAGSDPSSAVYVDGVYLARPAMVLSDFMEVDRVEVLRGPQGTLYGRNAVGGAVNVVTKSPSNRLEASVRTAVGNVNTMRIEGRASGPLVRDKVLASASFLRGVRDGFVHDLNHPEHPLGGEDVTAGRAKLLLIVNPKTSLLLSGDVNYQDPEPLIYAKVLAVKPGFTVNNPRDLHQVRTSTLANSENMQLGGSARFTMQLAPNTTLTSLTAYRKLDYELSVDGDITELDLTISNVHEIQHQISEELTLTRHQKGLTWLGGLFLLNDVDRQPTLVHLPAAGVINLLNPHVDADSAALFGQGTLDLTSNLSVTAGLRYTKERKAIENGGDRFTLQEPRTIVPGFAYQYQDSISNGAWTPKIGVDLRANENALLYASVTRGFKSGGFNLTSQQIGRGFAPEWAWSYEAGLKTLMAGGRVKANVAAFTTDYSDLQVQTAISPGVIDISNAASATIHGIELESSAQLGNTLHAGGHLAWLDAKYDDYIAVGVGGVTGDVAGNRLSNAPEYSGRLWLEWTRRLSSSRSLAVRSDAVWQSTVFFTPFNDAIQRQRAYATLDASATLTLQRGLSIGGFARNLTNEDYITGSFNSPPPAIGGRPGDSRQFGIQLIVER